MTSPEKTAAALLREVLDERASRVTFSERDMTSRRERLHAGFARIDEAATRRTRVRSALGALPRARQAGWAAGAQAAVQIVLGQARRTSEVLVEAARDLLPVGPGAWAFAPNALVTRGEGGVTRADSEGEGPARTILVDDSGPEPGVVATIRNHPVDAPPPVLLIIPEDPDVGDAREIDPEIAPERSGDGVRLRYEATLPPGRYDVFFGNPRARA